MPCRDPRDDERIVYTKGVDPEFQRKAERLQKKVNELTDLLCQTGRARLHKKEIPVSVLKWWDDHCEMDRKRGEPW